MSQSLFALILAILAMIVAIIAIILANLSWQVGQASLRRWGSHRLVAGANRPREQTKELPYVIANPAKIADLAGLQKQIAQAAQEAGIVEPKWLLTSIESPGTAQAIEATKAGATVVLAIGGDGTLRAVAAGVAHTKTDLAIIPLGTGNLYARNFSLPYNDLEECISIAFTGAIKKADLGWLSLVEATEPSKIELFDNDTKTNEDQDKAGKIVPEGAIVRSKDSSKTVLPQSQEFAFLVIAGMGIDGDMMSAADPRLKQKIGWWAYAFSGLKGVRNKRMNARITLGDYDSNQHIRARSVIFANCGWLMGGMKLLPEAVPDDGWIDIAALDTRGGMLGWYEILGRAALSGAGLDPSLPALTSNVHTRRARTATLLVDRPRAVQVDGDSLGLARGVRVRLEHAALRVRVR